MLDGVIIIDKPKKVKSNELVGLIKNVLGVKKAGHSGTLDPNATGVLLIAINEATKIMPLFSKLEKEYVGTITLHHGVNKEDILNARRKFIGKITQFPPKKSAVRRIRRVRKIYSFDIMSINRRDIKFRIKCEAGTYIRKLAYDFGQTLGCGAHLSELRRVKVGPFSENDAIKIESLKTANILKIESCLEHIGIKKVHVKVKAIQKTNNGVSLMKKDLKNYDSHINEGDTIAIYYKERILALGRAIQNFDNIKDKEFLIKINRVFKID